MKNWSDFNISIPDGRSGEVATTCPKCSPHRKNQKAKCLSANTDKNLWKCHHCGWSGSLEIGEDRKSNPWEWVPKKYYKPVFKPEEVSDQSKLFQWFIARGIPAEVVAKNKIISQVAYMPQIEAETKVIQFPYYRNGEVINIKHRDLVKNFRMESGAERIFYGMDFVGDASQLIIVEGEIDKLSIETAGFANCVSVPDGAPSPTTKDYTSKFEFLENCEEFLARFDSFILAVDNDLPGQTLEKELARRLGRERCSRIQWPEGSKDANDVLMEHGRDKLADCINQARPYPVMGLFNVEDIMPEVLKLYEGGQVKGALTGWSEIDEFVSFTPGRWSLVTGIPGHGKSEWLDALMVNLANNYGWRFAIFSPENQPLEMHFAKLAEKYIGKPFFSKDRMTTDEINKAGHWIGQHFQFVLPDENSLAVENILKVAKASITRKGVKGIVIDPWNELDHSRPATLTETEYISQCLSKIRRFARDNDVHVFLVAHPTKLRKEKDPISGELKYPVPTPYDVSGAAHWRNKADIAITIHRPDVTIKEGTIEVHIQKVRFKSDGKPGLAVLNYEYRTGRFYGGSKLDDCPFD